MKAFNNSRMKGLGRRPTALDIFIAMVSVLFCPASGQAQIFSEVTLEQVTDTATVSPASRPVAIRHAGDGSGRLFIVRQAGDILIYDPGTDSLLPTPFLDISARVDDGGNEQGLLGLAFHPNYAANGYFYVNYTRDPGTDPDRTVIARYSVSNDPNVADTAETVLLEIVQTAGNHNGGDMHFGPDGYLYIGMGDGGGNYDDAQNLGNLLGAMLRIDVDAPTPAPASGFCGLNPSGYDIPDGNPYKGADQDCPNEEVYCKCDEIWSYGLRNPWRWSFDHDTGDIFIGDVGQNAWAEIDFQPAAMSGTNYGWPCREGKHNFDTSPPCAGPLFDPIMEYAHGGSPCNAVTGGYRYRGKYLPMNGTYVYGEYCQGNIWFANKAGGTWPAAGTEWMDTSFFITSFGEDEDQELYLAEAGGGIYRIKTPECPSRICPEGVSSGWRTALPLIGP